MRFKHLKETGYTYKRHFVVSMTWCYRKIKLALCAFIHAFYPDVFTDTVSINIKKYAKNITEDSKKSKDPDSIS